MSRCFPFPPPGYEKKARPDEDNLLEKEKQKEKKHKKDKKDKKKNEKDKKDREGKHKDKERSEDKRREKKDRKEKRKHKNEKYEDKEKKKPIEEKKSVGIPECSTVDNPGSSGTQTQSDETSDFKFLVELGKRIKDEDEAAQNLMVKKINLTGKICSGFPGRVVDSNIGNIVDRKEKLKEQRISDKKDCEQTNKFDARGSRNCSVQNLVLGQPRKVEGVAGLVGKNVEKRMVPDENDVRKFCESIGDDGKDRDQEGGNKWSKGREKVKEANKDQQLKARTNSRNTICDDSNTKSLPLFSESNKNSHLGKRKERGINGFLHDDQTRPYKLQRPISSSQEVVETREDLEPAKTANKSVPELGGMVSNHKLNSKSVFSHRAVEDGSKFDATLPVTQLPSQRQRTGNNHKVNNDLPSHPNLANRRTSSHINNKVDNKVGLAHPVLENGRGELHIAAAPTAAGRHEAIGTLEVNDKEHKVNDLPKNKQLNDISTKPSSSTVKYRSRESRKPHPDTKYLSKILAVPCFEWSDFDNQEWLYEGTSLQKHKANPSCSQVEETEEVWAKALQLESTDAIALPYVIPY